MWSFIFLYSYLAEKNQGRVSDSLVTPYLSESVNWIYSARWVWLQHVPTSWKGSSLWLSGKKEGYICFGAGLFQRMVINSTEESKPWYIYIYTYIYRGLNFFLNFWPCHIFLGKDALWLERQFLLNPPFWEGLSFVSRKRHPSDPQIHEKQPMAFPG